MTERARADHGSAESGFPFQISKLLVVCVIAATAATLALVITVLFAMPGSGSASGPAGLTLADLKPLAFFPLATGLFVLTWLAALVVFARDQLLLRIQEIEDDVRPDPAATRRQLAEMLAELRAELAVDRARALRALDERLAEYGERRETNGFRDGMRVATTGELPDAKLRSAEPITRQR